MSQAEELLETLTSDPKDIAAYIAGSEDEEHIIIDENRIVNVPTSLRRIAVQYDHNVETVTFDCPRYWDERDLSSMHIYINYSLPSGTKGRYLTKDLRVDETDENIIHFDWVITNEFTYESGGISFLICAVQTDSEGVEEVHWNTEINNQLTVSRGMECSEIIPEAYPDIINDIFTRLDTVIADNDEIIGNNEAIIQNNADLNTQLNNVLESNTKLTNQAQAAVDSHNELAERITYVSDNMEEVVNVSVAEANADLSEDFYYLKNDVLETGEASGSFINAKDTTLARLQRIKVKGPGEQVTTTGKNKFDVSKLPMTLGGITISVDDKGNVVLNGTPTITSDYINFIVSQEIDFEPDTYTMSVENKKAGIGIAITGFEGRLNLTLSETENSKSYTSTEKYTSTLQINVRYDVGTLNNFILNPQLEVGQTKTTYEMFTGGQASPSPSYPQNIEVIEESFEVKFTGKNILNFETYQTKTPVNSWVEIQVKNPFIEAGTYSYSCTGEFGTNYKLWVRSSEKTIHNIGNRSSFIITEEELNTIEKVIVVVEGLTPNTSYSGNIYPMIQKGNVLTEYDPYQETKILYSLPDGEFFGAVNEDCPDEFVTEFNEVDGKFHNYLDKFIRRIVFTGNEENLVTRDIHDNIAQFELYNRDGLYTQYDKVNAISTHYKGVAFMNRSQGHSWTIDNAITIISTGNIVIMTSQFSGVTDFKAHLKQLYNNGTPVIVDYVLAEPYRIDLGPVDMPLSQDSETNVFSTHELSPKTTITYHKNFKKTIENMQVNEKALKQELIDLNTRLSALETSVASIGSEVVE